MADLQAILSAALNVVQAINNLGSTYREVQGNANIANITGTLLVSPTGGRLATVSITSPGNTTGTIYDGNAVTALSRPIYTIPTTLGVVFVNLPVAYGIVAVPGTGQTITIGYS